MLFINTAITLLASAAVASALSHEPAAFEHSNLERRACPKVLLTTSQKKEAAALSALAKSISSKSKSIASKSRSLNSKSKSVQSKAASLAAKSTSLSKASAALASKSAAVSSKSASVNSKSSSVSARQSGAFSSLSSLSSSISSASSALAAATSAAGASSHCYAIANLDVTLTSHAAGPSECATFCGANYDVIALVEPNSPPATCLCVNAAALSDLTPVSPTLCDATYGSKNGVYATGFSV